MAKYHVIAEDLRRRITGGEWAVGDQLPSIAELQQHYETRAYNTVRMAQQLLVDESLVEARQGVGVFVVSTTPAPRPVDVIAELRNARAAVTAAITALERNQPHE